MTYPTELVEKAKYEVHVFERVSADTGVELLAEVERLRDALRPFAALAEHYPRTKMYGGRPTTGVLFEVSSANKTAGYTVEDLHAAAALVPNVDRLRNIATEKDDGTICSKALQRRRKAVDQR